MALSRLTAPIRFLSIATLLAAAGCSDPLECGAGTVASGDLCIPYDETLARTADLTEAAEPNGPGEAGVAGSFDAPALGASTTFYGCITPTTDADGDGNLDADYDNWEVTASGPMVLEITTDGIRGLSAGFVVVTADPALLPTLQNWQRFGINRTGDTSSRELFLPAAGTYSLQVTDVRSLFGDGGAGSANTCYFGTVKHVATPAPATLAVPSTAGQDEGRVQLFEFTATGTGDILDLNENSSAPAFSPAFLTLRNGLLHGSAAPVLGGFGTTPPFGTVGGLDVGDVVTIVADAEYNYALEPQDFTLDSFHIQAQPLPTSGAVLTVTELNGSSGAGYPDLNFLYFDVATAGVKRFDLVASKPVDMAIVRSDVFTGGAFDYIASINAFGATGQATFQGEFVRFLAPGRYYFVAQNPAATSAGGTYTITSTVTEVATTPLTLGTAADLQPLPAGSAFHSLDLADPIWIEFGITATSDWGAGVNVTIESYDLAAGGWLRSGTPPATVPPGNVYPAFTGTQPSVAPFAPTGRILAHETRDFLLRVKPTGTPGASPTYSLLVQDRPNVVNLGTVTPGTPVNRSIPALTNGSPARFIAFGASGNTLRSLAHPLASVDLREVRLNAAEGAIATINATGVAGDETLVAITGAAPNDWIAWTVENLTAVVSSDVDLTVTTVAPRPYTITSGAIPYVDACVGGTTLGTGLDDQVITAQTLPAAFSGFQLFGEPVPATFRVGANGFISWDTSAIPTFGWYSNQTIPLAGAPNGVIAPFWQDFDTLTLCRKDDAVAETVTYQWSGKLWSLTPVVQFQAILHSNGVIDFVYGPTHAATGATPDGDGNGATVGAENLTGTFGHQIVFNQPLVTANTSYTLTPQ